MITPIVVMKFGGTSVEDAQAFERVTRIIAAQERVRPVVVVSAMSKVTDALASSFRLAAEGSPGAASQSLEGSFRRHLEVAHRLLRVSDCESYREALEAAGREIDELLHMVAGAPAQLRPPLEDRIVSYGEQLSTALLTSVLLEKRLPARYVDARRCIVTDGVHGRGTPLPHLTALNTCRELNPVIDAAEIPVLGGFIAATESGLPTTLGRNGSDYTAALVAAALNASEIQIWTDVTGVLTADPRLVKGARTVPLMSYEEAAELSRLGSKVIYPQAVQPAAAQNIPLRICNSRAPHEGDTLICDGKEVTPGVIKSIAHKPGLAQISIKARQSSGNYEFQQAFFEVLQRHGVSVDALGSSEASISLTLGERWVSAPLLEELRRLGDVEVEGRRALISVVGAGLRGVRGVAARALGAVSDLNVFLVLQDGSDSNLMLLLDEERGVEAARRLHRALFEEGAGEVKDAPAEALDHLNHFPVVSDSLQ